MWDLWWTKWHWSQLSLHRALRYPTLRTPGTRRAVRTAGSLTALERTRISGAQISTVLGSPCLSLSLSLSFSLSHCTCFRSERTGGGWCSVRGHPSNTYSFRLTYVSLSVRNCGHCSDCTGQTLWRPEHWKALDSADMRGRNNRGSHHG
jgi:hypothetical protein